MIKTSTYYWTVILFCWQILVNNNVLYGQVGTQVAPDEILSAHDLFITKQNRVLVCTSGGVYTSDNLGANWQKLPALFNTVYFHPNIALNQKESIYLWDRNHGIYMSEDNATTWKEQSIYLPEEDRMITAFAVEGDTAFVGTTKGLKIAYGPANDIKKIQTVTHFKGLEIKSLLVRGKFLAVGTAKNGLYTSYDRGKTWSNNQLPLPEGVGITTITQQQNKLYVGTFGNGVYYSTDGGKQWKVKNEGLKNLHIQDFWIFEDKIYAVSMSYENVYVSSLDDAAWKLINNNHSIGQDYRPQCIVAKENVVLVGTYDGLFKSTNDGTTWAQAYSGIKGSMITSFQVDSDSTVWATAGPNRIIYKKEKNAVNFSIFQENVPSGASSIGETLVQKDQVLTLTMPIRVLSKENAQLISAWGNDSRIHFPEKLFPYGKKYFLSTLTQGVWQYTPDQGWEEYNTGLPDENINSSTIQDTVLYVATNQGLFKSSANQVNWKKITLGTRDGAIYKIFNLNHLLLASGSENTFVSYNNGSSWQPLSATQNYYFRDVIEYNKILYGTTYSEIYYSVDNGKTWKKSFDFNYSIECLSAVNNTLYLGTVEDGIFAFAIKDVLKNSIVTAIAEPIDDLEPLQVFPNPTTQFISLKNFTGQKTTEISILNQNGQVVWDDKKDFRSQKIDISTLAAGMYMVKVKNNDQIKTLRFIKN